jgi:hypothetical protein
MHELKILRPHIHSRPGLYLMCFLLHCSDCESTSGSSRKSFRSTPCCGEVCLAPSMRRRRRQWSIGDELYCEYYVPIPFTVSFVSLLKPMETIRVVEVRSERLGISDVDFTGVSIFRGLYAKLEVDWPTLSCFVSL